MELFEEEQYFNGVFAQPTVRELAKSVTTKVEMVITKINKEKKTFAGEIIWKETGNSRSKIRGKYSNTRVYIVEYELIDGRGIAFPTLYKGKIIDSSISGIVKHADYQGTFYLEKR